MFNQIFVVAVIKNQAKHFCLLIFVLESDNFTNEQHEKMSEDIFKGVFYSYFMNHSTKHINRLVKIKANSTHFGKPINLLDPNVNSSQREDNWQSRSIENSSLTITLLRERLKISSYSLKSRTDWTHNTPYEWILEGSNDLMNWETIHHKPHGDELIYANTTGHWECSSSIPFRFFKLTQLNENKKSDEIYKYMFTLNKIEFFGTLFPNEPMTCINRKPKNCYIPFINVN